MFSIIIGLLVFAGIVVAILVFNSVRVLSKIRMAPGKSCEVSVDSLTGDELVAYESLIQVVEAEGFVHLGFRRDGNDFIDGLEPQPICVFRRHDGGVFVDAQFSDSPQVNYVWRFTMTTIADSGHAVVTHDASNVEPISYVSGVSLHIASAIDFRGLLREHLEAVEAQLGACAKWSGGVDGYGKWVEQWISAQVALGLQNGELLKLKGEEVYKFSRKSIFKAVMQILGMQKRYQAAQKRIKKCADDLIAGDNDEAMVEASCYAYKKHIAVRDNTGRGPIGGLIWLFVSLVVFMVAFQVVFSWEVTVAIVAVLFIHELGHILAMKLFGYRDLRMLFIPMLGAVAIGKHENVKAWQEVVMLFMGPLPGIALGFILLVYQAVSGVSDSLLDTTILLLIFINVFNLLPVKPLDGGRIIGLVVFYRFPNLQAIFNVLSGLGLVLIGLLLDARFLWILGAIFILNSPTFWRQAQMLKFFRGRYHPPLVDEERASLLREMFSLYTDRKYKKVVYAKRIEDVKQVSESVAKVPPGWFITGLTICIYLFPLWMPIAAIWPVHYINEQNLARAEQQWEATEVQVGDTSTLHGELEYAALLDAYYQRNANSEGVASVYLLRDISLSGVQEYHNYVNGLLDAFVVDAAFAAKFDAFLVSGGEWSPVLTVDFVEQNLYESPAEQIGLFCLVEALQHFRDGRIVEGITEYRKLFIYAEKLERSSIASFVGASYSLRTAAINSLASVSRQSDVNWPAVDQYMREYLVRIYEEPKCDWPMLVVNQKKWNMLEEQVYGEDEVFDWGWFGKVFAAVKGVSNAYGFDDFMVTQDLNTFHRLIAVGPQLKIGKGSLNFEFVIDDEGVDWAKLLSSFSYGSYGLVDVEDQWRHAAITSNLAEFALDMYKQKATGGVYQEPLGVALPLNRITSDVLSVSVSSDGGSFELFTYGVPYDEVIDEYTSLVYWVGEDAIIPESYDFYQ